jgi:hypothetical protein
MNNFKLILNSSNGIGSNPNSLSYFYDFSQHEEGVYELTFSYIGGDNDIDPSQPAEVFISFNTLRSYACQVNNSGQAGAVSTNHIGLLSPIYLSATNGYLRANMSDNTSSYLRLPYINTFSVNILTRAGVPYTDSASANLASYIMTLAFKKIA